MKTFKEFISEKVFMTTKLRTMTANKGVEFDIFINPSNSEVNQLWTESKSRKEHFIRGFVSPKFDLYLWRGDIMHGDVLGKYDSKMDGSFDELFSGELPLDETGFCFTLDSSKKELQISDIHEDNKDIDQDYIKLVQNKHKALSNYKIKLL